MSEDQDDSQKTEEPTHKRLEEARKRGQIYSSKEINSFLLFFVFALMLAGLADNIGKNTLTYFSSFITQPDLIPGSGSGLIIVLREATFNFGIVLVPVLIAFMAILLFAGLIQRPLIWSAHPMIPKLEKISPLKGVKRLFSMRSLAEFIKGLIKITIIGIVGTFAIWPQRKELERLPSTDITGLLHFMQDMAGTLLMGVLIALFFIAILDYLYQRFDYIKNLRMSKQEIRDEYKQQEGDPQIKARIRQIRMERARKRMMAEVPTSDVVITNPTHYAVALRYDNMQMAAPMVVAKGKNKVALKIREIAEEHDIPIMENPPLARALFTVNLEEQIPYEHFKAVAEIISYVYKMKGKTIRPR